MTTQIERGARMVTALRDVGLRLTSSTSTRSYIVVDHIERLTPN
jgi:hypothetical protein